MAWKDLFIKKEEPKVAPNKPAATQVAIMTVGGNASALTSSAGNVDYNKLIDDNIKQQVSTGKPGYAAFMASIERMAKVSLPEKAKYETVFITFEGMGVTAEQLVVDAGRILGTLDQLKASVEQDITSTRAAEVTAKEVEAAKLQEEIVELNRQAEEKSIRVNQLLAEKEEAAQQLFVEENNFNNTLNLKVNAINANMSKIKTYLNGASNE
jgi:hypothetical protein